MPNQPIDPTSNHGAAIDGLHAEVFGRDCSWVVGTVSAPLEGLRNNGWQRDRFSTIVRHMGDFAICVNNSDDEASLTSRRIYEIIPDELGAEDDLRRIVDESGEDYLYHKSHFMAVELPMEAEHSLLAAQGTQGSRKLDS